MKLIKIDGRTLKLEDIESIVLKNRLKIEFEPRIISNISKGHKFLNGELNSWIIYGVSTGFGPMASHILGKNQLIDLQKNLIHSHAVGMGELVDQKFVLSALLVRANTLARGYSGISEGLLRQMQLFINHRIIPAVPEHGGVGASGDLVQLAHLALALIGEGRVFYRGKIQPTAKVFEELKIKPYKLQPKEGLALINGTSFMTGIGALVWLDSRYLLDLAIKTGALAVELVAGFKDSMDEKLHSLRPHPGQVFVARIMRELLATSKLLRDREQFQKRIRMGSDVKEILESVQEVYSLRCIPQVLGPVYDTLRQSRKIIETEINSVTDNPVVDRLNQNFLHGGNFHGDYVASTLDQLKAAMVKLTMLSERRTNFFMNRNINKFLPPFLNLNKPGLTLALQGLQFVATSTTAQSQSLAFPHYVHSIPSNGDNQDIVSMGTDGALMAHKVVQNAFVVLAVELVTLAQAVDCLKIQKKLSKPTLAMYRAVRKVFPKVVEDRIMGDDLDKLLSLLKEFRI